MFNSSNRMDFIIECLSSYKAKIQMANRSGLLDNAKMFELFAIDVCKIWFGQDFHNLNEETSNFSYLDLVSDDGQLFVQVSTTQNPMSKIKTILEKIRDSKDLQFKDVNNVVFFMLCNISKNSKDCYENTQIGNLLFAVEDNLITVDNVISKAQNELDFQKNLYEVLKREFDDFSEVVESFEKALDMSLSGLKSIDIQINHEYEIDRSKFIDKIKSDNKRFISVQGDAGSGKSVLCKKYIQEEELVLYTRAERFSEESHLDNIWGCCIQDVLEYINGKKIIFFIDALEFIADCSESKIELLNYLYDVAEKHQNVYVLTSCRTSDKNAFIRLESNHLIQVYEVENISDDELKSLMARYPILCKIKSEGTYDDLLKCPFYINLIVSNKISIDNINDENSFRDLIWENIICLKEKTKLYHLHWDQVVASVEYIVFERAKKFLLCVHKDKVDSKILDALISEGVVLPYDDGVRLKYDIFEDICFEQYFDKEFKNCKGQFETFYSTIESLGRCVYRRYQIWIANKIFVKENREKFLYALIFSNTISPDWKRQTEVGIIKSKYCDSFFEEQELALLEQNMLPEFIHNTNLFAFNYNLSNTKETFPKMQLFPIGNGRPCLIRTIKNQGIYKKNVVNRNDLVKLCLDYTKQKDKADDVVNDICFMMEYFVDYSLGEPGENRYYRIIDEITPCLEVLYKFGEDAKDWLRNFFAALIHNYTIVDSLSRGMSKDLIEWTLKNCCGELMMYLADELCEIADIFWMREDKETPDSSLKWFRKSDEYSDYGLNEQAEQYDYNFRSIYENKFLFSLFSFNPRKGLSWAIEFINKAVSNYITYNPDDVEKIKLWTVGGTEIKEYWGNIKMWLAGTEDYQMPTLLSDIVYILRTTMINILTTLEDKHELFVSWANYIKGNIYTKSNNVLLLTVIENIGMHFESELPGYALELASSLSIIYYDNSRYVLYDNFSVKNSLEQRILLTMGIPGLNNRYELDPKCNFTISEYMCRAQMCYDSEIQSKCLDILDYLYSTEENIEENAMDFLQIQKMDLRNAKTTKIDEETYILEPQITGAAEKIVIEQHQSNEPLKELEAMRSDYTEKKKSGQPDLSQILEVIEKILALVKNNDEAILYEQMLISSITIALNDTRLKVEDREAFCIIWLDGLERLLSNGSFLADLTLTPVLLNQLETDINIELQNRIKVFMLECLLKAGENGVVAQLGIYIREYLVENKSLDKAIFYTIIKLSESKLKDADRHKIIEENLFQEKILELDGFDVTQYDIAKLCSVANCSLNFSDIHFKIVIQKMLLYLIDTWKEKTKNHEHYDVINAFQESEIVNLFQREMVQKQDDAGIVIDLLFDDIDFRKFTDHTIEFYQNIFGNFLCEFFDAYEEPLRRNICKKKILYIEEKVNEIEDIYVREQFFKSLMLSVTIYSIGNWQKIKTHYTYDDLQFLNGQFTKYGKYYIGELLRTIYQMHIDELLPEILISIRNSFQYAMSEDSEKFQKSVKEQDWIVRLVILKSYVSFSGEIKKDQELFEAFEGILGILIELNYEQAAVILDAFRMY